MNAAYRQVFERSGLIGVPARDAFPDVAGQQLSGAFDRVYATGEPLTAREWRVQPPRRRRDAPGTVPQRHRHPRLAGDGVAASAAMGQLRAVLGHRLRRGARPADGSLSYCTARHPPPLLLTADGEPRFMPVTGAGPLATGSGFPLGTDKLGDGDVLLLHTDGILGRPGRDLAARTVELAQAAADIVAGKALYDETTAVERATTQTLELLVRGTGVWRPRRSRTCNASSSWSTARPPTPTVVVVAPVPGDVAVRRPGGRRCQSLPTMHEP